VLLPEHKALCVLCSSIPKWRSPTDACSHSLGAATGSGGEFQPSSKSCLLRQECHFFQTVPLALQPGAAVICHVVLPSGSRLKWTQIEPGSKPTLTLILGDAKDGRLCGERHTGHIWHTGNISQSLGLECINTTSIMSWSKPQIVPWVHNCISMISLYTRNTSHYNTTPTTSSKLTTVTNTSL